MQRVVLGVADLGLVENVVEMFVTADLLAKVSARFGVRPPCGV